jgi:hypothetical protein
LSPSRPGVANLSIGRYGGLAERIEKPLPATVFG